MGGSDESVRWLAEEERVRARLISPGVASAEEVASRSGMEIFNAIFDGGTSTTTDGRHPHLHTHSNGPGLGYFSGPPAGTSLQPHGNGSWRLVCNDSRFSGWVRDPHHATCREGLYDPGAQGE